MKYFMCMTLILNSYNVMANQGTFIPPEPYRGEAKVVRMMLGDDHQAPTIDVGISGPTVVIFPADVAYCTETSSVFGWKKEGEAKVNGQDWLREMIFFLKLDPANIGPEQERFLRDKPHSFVCRLDLPSKKVFREIKLRLNPQKRRAVVYLEHPLIKRVKDFSMFKKFNYIEPKEGKIHYKKAKMVNYMKYDINENLHKKLISEGIDIFKLSGDKKG